MEEPAGYIWPSLIGNEGSGDFSFQSSAESIAATTDSRYIAVSFKSTDTTIVGTGPNPKGIALLDTTANQWLFVQGINNQSLNLVCHVYFNPNQNKVLAQYSQVQGVDIYPAFAFFDFSGNLQTSLVLQIAQVSNKDEPYQFIQSGLVMTQTDTIFIAINYTINETTPGANVNGDRRMALCRISLVAGVMTLDLCKYYEVETNWGRIQQNSSSLTYFTHPDNTVTAQRRFRIFGCIAGSDSNTSIVHWDTDLNSMNMNNGDRDIDQKRLCTHVQVMTENPLLPKTTNFYVFKFCHMYHTAQPYTEWQVQKLVNNFTQTASSDQFSQRIQIYRFKYLAAYFKDINVWEAVGLDLLTNKVFFITGHLTNQRVTVYPMSSTNQTINAAVILASGNVFYAGSALKIETYGQSYMSIFPTTGAAFTSSTAMVSQYSRNADLPSCIRHEKIAVFDCDNNCSGTSQIVPGDNASDSWNLHAATDIALAKATFTFSSTKMTNPGSWLSTQDRSWCKLKHTGILFTLIAPTFDGDDTFWVILEQPSPMAFADWTYTNPAFPGCTDVIESYTISVKLGAVASTDLNETFTRNTAGNSLIWDKMNSVPVAADPNVISMSSSNTAILANTYTVTVTVRLINAQIAAKDFTVKIMTPCQNAVASVKWNSNGTTSLAIDYKITSAPLGFTYTLKTNLDGCDIQRQVQILQSGMWIAYTGSDVFISPGWTFWISTNNLSLDPSSVAPTIQFRVQLGSPNLATAITKVALTVDVTWKHKCRYAVFTNQTVSNMTNIVKYTNVTQTIPTFAHSESPTDCGSQVLTITICTPISRPTCTLANFFTLIGSQISVGTLNEADVGTYTVTLKVAFVTYPTISLTLNPFEVKIDPCLISTITPLSTLSDVIYHISDPAITRTPSYSVSPSVCPNELVLTVTLIDGSPLPAAISYSAPNIQVTTMIYEPENTYTVKVLATDPKTGITNAAVTFQVTVKCTKSIDVSTNPIPDTVTYNLDPNNLFVQNMLVTTYQPKPSLCPLIPLYSIKNVASEACVSWLTCNPTTQFTISTMDLSLVGTYNFRIDLTDASSNVTNSSVIFTVIIKVMNATAITMSSKPGNQTYAINSASLLLDLPTYTWFPTQSQTAFTYAITAGPSFVTIGGIPAKIQIFTSTPSDTGTYRVYVKTTEANSGLTETIDFNLLVTCISSFAPSFPLTDVIYFITDPAITRTPSYDLTPSTCIDQLVLTVTLSDGSPLPAAITYSAPNISVQTTDYTVNNVYTVKVVATDPTTGITNSAITLQVTVKCIKNISLVSDAISDFDYQIRISLLFILNLPLPQYNVNPNQCASAPFSYEVVSTDAILYPAFISQYPTSQIEVKTQDESKVGAYNFKLKVTEPISGLVNDQNAFVCTITAPSRATSLSLITATQIADFTYLLGSPELVFDSPSYTFLPVNADTNFAFSLNTSAPLFITIVPQGTANPKIKVLTSDVTYVGIYTITYTVSEVFSQLFVSEIFVVTVSCVSAIDLTSTMASFVYFINDPKIDLLIPLYKLTPATCPYELEYQATLIDGQPLPSAISLVLVNGQQTIRVIETVPEQTGVYTVQITVIDPKSGIQNTALTQEITVKCTKSLKLVNNPIPSQTIYTINRSQLLTKIHLLPDYEPYPNNCPIGQVTYQVELDPVSLPFPAFITEIPTTQINFGTTDQTTEGVYKFKVVTTDQLTGLQNNEVGFEVTMIAIDDLILIESTAISAKTYKVSDPALVLQVPQYSLEPPIAASVFVNTLASLTPSFISLVDTDQNAQIKIEANDLTWTGVYQVTISVFEENSQITKTYSFSLTVSCVRSVTTASTINDQIYYIGDTQITIDMPSYSLTPNGCPLELIYSAKLVDGSNLPQSIEFNGLQNIFIYEENPGAAAVYQVKIIAQDQKTLIKSDEFIFKVTIRLRVTGLNILTGTNISDLTYRVGTPALVLNAPEYTLEPANANVDSLYELGATTPAFVTLLGGLSGPVQIQIVTADPSHTGIYEIDIHYTDQFSGLKMTDTFLLTVSCVSQITVINNVPQMIYFITDVPIDVPLPNFQIIPADCPNEIFISAVTLSSGETLPAAIRFDGFASIDIFETNHLATGQYTVMVTVTDPKSKLKNTDLIFSVTVKCTKSIDVVIANLPTLSIFEIDEKHLKSLTLSQPTFQPNPTQCAIGPYKYELADSSGDVIAHPPFLTQFENSSLKVSTIDKSFENVYDWSIKVTEPISGLTNNNVKFLVQLTVKIYALQMNLIANTIIPDQNYLIGSPAMNLLAYQYNFVPNNAQIDVVYSLINPPAFVSLIDMSGQWVLIQTSDLQDTSIYQIQVKTLDRESGLQQTQSFKLTVSCVRQIDPTGPLADVTYWITDLAIERLPTYNLTPPGCPNELVYQVTLVDGSPLPSSIVFIQQGAKISVQENDYTRTAQYQVKIEVSDPKSGLKNSDLSFQVTFKCTKTIDIVANPISDFSYLIDLDVPWTKQVSVPAYGPNPSQCAVGNYLLEVINQDGPTFPPFINQLPTDKLIVTTQDVIHVASHNFKIKASESLSGLVNELETFVLTILKPVYTEKLVLVEGTELEDLNYTIYSPKVVLDVPRYEVFPADADRKLVYSLDPSTPAFVTLVPNANGEQTIQIISSSNNDLGVYTITVILTEAFSGIKLTESFTLTVSCVTKISQYYFLSPVIYFIRDADIVISIPSYSITPNICPVELMYSAAQADDSPLPNAISLLNDNGAHFLRLSETDPALTGFYTVRITVVDPKSGLSNANLTVQVTIQCTKSITLLTGEIPDIFRLNQIDPAFTQTSTMPTYDVNPAFCLKQTFELSIVYDGVPFGTTLPTWLKYDQSTLVMKISDELGVGAYNFYIEALEPRSGLINTQVAFKVVSSNGPVATKITAQQPTLIADQTYLIGDQPTMINAPLYDKFPSYVEVQYLYDFVTPYPFIEVIYDPIAGPNVKISSTNPLDYGQYEIELRATESFSGLTSITKFGVQIDCVRSILPTTQVSDLTYFISDVKTLVQLPIIQLQPLLCPYRLQYSLKMQDSSALPSSIALDTTQGSEQVSVQETDWLKAGVFPILVTVNDETTSVTTYIPFTVTIKCTKNLSLSINSLPPVQYNVGTDSLQVLELALPTYEPLPKECAKGPIEYELIFLNDETAAFPNFISEYPQSKIVVASQETTYLGQNKFKIIATDLLTGLKNDSLTLDVVLFCKTLKLVPLTSNFNNNISYIPGIEGKKTTKLPDYDFVPARCKGKYKTEIMPINRNLQTTSELLPEWIWLSDDQTEFYLFSMDAQLSGTHAFKLRTSIPEYNVVNEDISFTISFDCPITDILASALPSDFTYYIDPNQIKVASILLPRFAALPEMCNADFILSFSTNSTTANASDFAKIDIQSNMLILNSTNIDLLGFYVMKIKALEPRRGIIKDVIFNLTIDCKVTKVYIPDQNALETSFKYFLGASSYEIPVPKYATLPERCGKPPKLTLFVSEIDGVSLNNNQALALPSFIFLDADGGVIKLYGANMYEAQKSYKFYLGALEPKSRISDKDPYTFTVQVIGQSQPPQLSKSQPPQFSKPLKDIVLTQSKLQGANTLKYTLPPITGAQVAIIRIQLGKAAPFLSFNQDKMLFEVTSSVALNTAPQNIPVTIILQDEFEGTTKATFTVVLFFPEKLLEKQKDNEEKPAPADIIRNQDITGVAMKEDFINDTPFKYDQDSDKIWTKIDDNQAYNPKAAGLAAKISKVQIDGQFQVNWSHEIYTIRKESLVNKNAVQVRIVWMNEAILSQQEDMPTYRTRIEDVNERFISFRLLFDDPDLISRGSQLDIVEVNFSNTGFFIRLSDSAIIEPSSRILIQEIPRQVGSPVRNVNSIKSALSTTKSAAGLGITSMAASAATGVSSATVFGLFHTIQLISMQAYTGSEMPANAANVFKTIDEFLRGGSLNPAKFWNKMIANKSESTIPVLSRRLQSQSGPTKAQTVQTMVSTQFFRKNPIIESGFFVMVIVLCILISILLVIFNKFCSKLGYCEFFFSSYMFVLFKRIFMFNLMVQAQISGYIYFVLSCIKKKVLFQHLLDARSTLEGVNIASYYLIFIYVTIYPIMVCLFLLLAGESGLNNSEIKAHIGILYSELDVEKPINAQFVTLFLLRRLIVGITITFFRTYYFLQLEILMVSSMFCLCFLLLCWPYKTLLNNVVEMINECLVILTVYIMHGFSLLIPDRNVRHDIGWLYIGLVGVVFVLNLSLIIQKVVLFVLLKVKQFKAQRQLMRKQNVHSRLFSWQPLSKGFKGKRKISENMVVPIYILNSEDTKRNPVNKIALHVIEEINESGFEDSSKHGESNKNESQENESLYRRVVSGQQNNDYGGSTDIKQSSDRNLIEEISDLVVPRTDSKKLMEDFVANDDLYRKVVSGQIPDYGSRNELKFYTDSKMIDDVGGLLLPRPSTGMSTEYENAKQVRSLTSETYWIENTRQNELTEYGTRIGFIENNQSSKNIQQLSQKQEPIQHTKKKQNFVNQINGSVSSDTESKKRNQEIVTLGAKKRSPIQDIPYPKTFENEVISQIKRTREQAYELYGFDPSKTEEESKRKGGQTKPNDKSKTQSNRFSVTKQLAEIENENDISKVHLPLGELGGWSDRKPNLDQGKTHRQPNQLIQYELSDRLRELERDILTPQDDREIKLFEEIENQNKAQVIFVKKDSIQFAQPFQEGGQFTSRSMEINDDEHTKGIRQASSRKYGAIPEPSRGTTEHQTHQTDSELIRTRTEQQPTKSKFGQRVPFRSQFGDLLQQMAQLTETQNTGQQELNDGKQAQIRPKTRQNVDTKKQD